MMTGSDARSGAECGIGLPRGRSPGCLRSSSRMRRDGGVAVGAVRANTLSRFHTRHVQPAASLATSTTGERRSAHDRLA